MLATNIHFKALKADWSTIPFSSYEIQTEGPTAVTKQVQVQVGTFIINIGYVVFEHLIKNFKVVYTICEDYTVIV